MDHTVARAMVLGIHNGRTLEEWGHLGEFWGYTPQGFAPPAGPGGEVPAAADDDDGKVSFSFITHFADLMSRKRRHGEFASW